MRPRLERVGKSQSPVVIIDEFSGDVDKIGELADELAPFPPIEGNYFPGVRRVISDADERAYAYVLATCERVAPFIGGAFDVSSFDLEEASFSVVALPPDELQPIQRAPHFDDPEQNLYAFLHYLRVPAASGTAFYRHRATGIERVTPANFDSFTRIAARELPRLPKNSGYIAGSDAFYEQIGRVDAIADRAIIYHSSLLHSGIIPAGMSFSGDPREGRLTANFFLRGR